MEDTRWESGETESDGFTQQGAEKSLLHRERTPVAAWDLSATSAIQGSAQYVKKQHAAKERTAPKDEREQHPTITKATNQLLHRTAQKLSGPGAGQSTDQVSSEQWGAMSPRQHAAMDQPKSSRQDPVTVSKRHPCIPEPSSSLTNIQMSVPNNRRVYYPSQGLLYNQKSPGTQRSTKIQ